MKRRSFARSGKDHATDELIAVLLIGGTHSFHDLFAKVHEGLRTRGLAGVGEEMLRLRVYEKLQALVAEGPVKKSGKEYSAAAEALQAYATARDESKARVEARKASLRVTE